METVGRVSRGRGLASSLHGSSSMVGRDVGPTLRQLRRQHSRQEKPPRLHETTRVMTSPLIATHAGVIVYAASREIPISPGGSRIVNKISREFERDKETLRKLKIRIPTGRSLAQNQK